MLPNKSAATGTSVLFFFISSAHVALAPSTCFMFAMQAFFWLAARAFTKSEVLLAWHRSGGQSATVTRFAEMTELKPLIEGNTAFALQLYGQLRSAEGNLFFSPYSISSALAIAYAGAGGETARQMEQVLQFTKCKTKLHEQFAQLAAVWKEAQPEQDIELHIANSLWPQ